MKKINIYGENKGITLIALVVTIIIIIILAGISINLLLVDGGILQRAREQKEEQIKAQILEELEMAKGPVTIDGEGYTKLEKYLEAIRNTKLANTYEVTSVEQIDEANAEIWIDGKYKYTAGQIGIDVIINEEGMIGKLKPQIKSFTIISRTSNSINVKVSARLAEKYEFYMGESKENYKKVKEITTNKKETSEIETITYMYGEETPLEEGKLYYLKVIARNDNGQVEKQIEKESIPIPIITVIEADTWTNKEKRVNIAQVEGYTIKYTIDETIPSAGNGENYTGEFAVSQNCTITAVYLDSENQIGGASTNTITKIDKEGPTGSITISSAGTNSIKVTVNANDVAQTNTNGCSRIKGYYYSKDGSEYSEITTNKEYTFEGLTQTSNYNIRVKVVDNAGNETILSKTGSTTTVPTPTITVANAETWTNTSKSVSINQTNGYTIKYTTNGTMPTASNGMTYTGSFNASQNCTIKALYIDSRNQIGSISEKQVTKIDKTPPKEAKIEISGSKTQASLPITLNAKITHEDSESGVNATSSKYILNTTSTGMGTNANSYTGGTFNNNGQTITIKPNSVANWYLHILTIDNAGNPKETIKQIGIAEEYHKHTGSSSSGGGCYSNGSHQHVSGCTKTCTVTGKCTSETPSPTVSGKGAHTYEYRHSSCGKGIEYGSDVATNLGRLGQTWTSTHTYTGCGNKPINKYTLGCGKTETTLDYYKITY